MRAYGHSYRDTMNLPIQVFWHLSGTVPRLLSGERKDTLELLTTATHNPEAASELFSHLEEVAPEPVKLTMLAIIDANSVRDEDGFNELKNM